MRVKIGDKIYDSNNEAIMIIFDEGEKELISNMAETSMKYLSYPKSMSVEEATEFMKTI